MLHTELRTERQLVRKKIQYEIKSLNFLISFLTLITTIIHILFFLQEKMKKRKK